MSKVTLDGEQAPIQVVITLYPSGAMSVEGPMDDKPFVLAILANAQDAVRNHGGPKKLIVPAKDVCLDS